MKTKVFLPLFFFVCTLPAIVLATILEPDPVVVGSLVIVSFGSVAFLILTVIRYVSDLVRISDEYLHQAHPGKSWLNNFDRLKHNQTKSAKKFKSAAEMIGQLVHPENGIADDKVLLNDPIGKALYDVRAEMEKLKDEDKKQAWVTEGLTQFSSILRNKGEIKEYSQRIISSLVKHLGANQGGLFIEYSKNNERFLELTACYAYDKKKHLDKIILEGQGLLGQCMLEKDFIFITDVPHDYISITSGLGLATPRNIIVAPLNFNNTFCGVIELASFTILQSHHIDFLKKVCEDIASEIVSIKNIEHTRALLDESHALSKELQEREEQMKLNLQQLAATQTEMANKQVELTGTVKEAERRQAELNSYMAAINNTIASAEFDLNGQFKDANEIFLKVMGYSKAELTGKPFDFFMGVDQTTVMMWENLRLGKFFAGEFNIVGSQKQKLSLNGTFNPIFTGGVRPDKIMMFAQFSTQEKEKLNDLTGMVHAFKSALPVIEFNEKFVCKTANEKALKIFGMSRLDLKTKSIMDFIDPYYHATWIKKQLDILNNNSSNCLIPVVTSTRATTYEVNVSVIKNLEGNVSKVIVILVKEVEQMVSVLAVV
jgi:PAS domain S-box-containing protein